ncbi:uncharacterized protein LOC6552276 isoform X2 [Drosophila erecta]|uniref:GG17114 n=1 Tax=Drosophila erecta TaxID=7220 RepID=B3P4R1_DROER|nr:uncharacterized protein LOC6552276 isoform X2 [Drosophila erecta]EDV49714.1 uncharacterized protein Dere_GG17114, isoform A [Drosophila erecta]
MDDSRRSLAGKIDSRCSSMATNDESVSMYLSFDAEDTLSNAKWQSALVTQSSQFLEVHTSKVEVHTDDKDLRRTVLKDLQQLTIGEPDQNSPLRPFDKSILNRHNALCSTPSKDNASQPPQILGMDLTHIYDKENSQPEGDNHNGGDNSTLSSSVNVTANTVKANTLQTDDATMDNVSVQEAPKTPAPSQVYPLSANVVLENITEVSNEGVSMLVSPEEGEKEVQVKEVVNEVSELIAKALKISADSVKPSASKLKVDVGKKRQSMTSAYSGVLPRPRRSFLPTTTTETRTYSFKQRMSVVVKTTLNSPARKLSVGGGLAVGRRSCLPVSKLTKGSNRKSLAVTSGRTPEKTTSKPSKLSIKSNSEAVFNCKHCGTTFRVMALLDMHMRMHDQVDNGPKLLKRQNTHPVAAGGSKNRCKFCDKNFALERALHIHLMQNCDKIPPSEKRKLQFTELNHEKKAQLPKIGGASGINHAMTMPQKPQQRMSVIPKLAPSNGTQSMAPPSVKKVPKSVAHAGVYRTPTKSVPCHICKQSFKSILEFTNHSLTVHAKNQGKKMTGGEGAPSAQD